MNKRFLLLVAIGLLGSSGLVATDKFGRALSQAQSSRPSSTTAPAQSSGVDKFGRHFGKPAVLAPAPKPTPATVAKSTAASTHRSVMASTSGSSQTYDKFGRIIGATPPAPAPTPAPAPVLAGAPVPAQVPVQVATPRATPPAPRDAGGDAGGDAGAPGALAPVLGAGSANPGAGAAVAPPAAPERIANVLTSRLYTDPAYAKFARLLKMGQPADQLRLRIQAEGLDPTVMDEAGLGGGAPAPNPAPVPGAGGDSRTALLAGIQARSAGATLAAPHAGAAAALSADRETQKGRMFRVVKNLEVILGLQTPENFADSIAASFTPEENITRGSTEEALVKGQIAKLFNATTAATKNKFWALYLKIANKKDHRAELELFNPAAGRDAGAGGGAGAGAGAEAADAAEAGGGAGGRAGGGGMQEEIAPVPGAARGAARGGAGGGAGAGGAAHGGAGGALLQELQQVRILRPVPASVAPRGAGGAGGRAGGGGAISQDDEAAIRQINSPYDLVKFCIAKTGYKSDATHEAHLLLGLIAKNKSHPLFATIVNLQRIATMVAQGKKYSDVLAQQNLEYVLWVPELMDYSKTVLQRLMTDAEEEAAQEEAQEEWEE